MTYALIRDMILLILDLWKTSPFLNTSGNKAQVLNLRCVIKTMSFSLSSLKFYRF